MTTEQVTNGGFETGDLTGWTEEETGCQVDNSTSHSGNYSLKTIGGLLGSVVQYFTPIAQDCIESFTAYYKTPQGYPAWGIGMQIIYENNSTEDIAYYGGTTNWSYIDLKSRLTPSQGKVKGIRIKSVGAVDAWTDDVSILVNVTTVQTNSATSVKSSTATLNGIILSLGSGNCDKRGFDWGISSGVYGFSWTETGSYGVSAFSRSIDAFGACITVYFRAKAHDSGGWHYGSELTLSFSLCSITNSYGALSCCNVIDVKMSETTKVAKRRVPKRATGEVVDYGTWTHEPMQLEITVRLSDSQKTTIEGIFNESATVTVTLTSDNGTWTFSGWLNAKEVAYDHSVDSNGISRPWRYRLAFNITSASFA
jgi:hypothetical protein